MCQQRLQIAVVVKEELRSFLHKFKTTHLITTMVTVYQSLQRIAKGFHICCFISSHYVSEIARGDFIISVSQT